MQIPEEVDFPIITEILGERDRGAAIVATGFLETKLTDAIKASLRDHEDTAKRLFKPTGPIGAFGNKALLGFMLKLYRAETLADLTLIGEIRNRFAHRPEPMTFGDDYVRERCEKLTLAKRVWSIIPTYKPLPRLFDKAAARKEFLDAVSLAANFLHHQSTHAEFRDRAEELLP